MKTSTLLITLTVVAAGGAVVYLLVRSKRDNTVTPKASKSNASAVGGIANMVGQLGSTLVNAFAGGDYSGGGYVSGGGGTVVAADFDDDLLAF